MGGEVFGVVFLYLFIYLAIIPGTSNHKKYFILLAKEVDGFGNKYVARKGDKVNNTDIVNQQELAHTSPASSICSCESTGITTARLHC